MSTDEKTSTAEKKQYKAAVKGWDGRLHPIEAVSAQAAAEELAEQYVANRDDVGRLIGTSLEIVVVRDSDVMWFEVTIAISLEVEEL